jgi:hypothetical protein
MRSDDGDAWKSDWIAASDAFAVRCATARDSNPYDRPALNEIMIFLATELWDRRFSVTEIKLAFEESVDLLLPYAAGEERRGDRRS